jgi:hypothetical protein
MKRAPKADHTSRDRAHELDRMVIAAVWRRSFPLSTKEGEAAMIGPTAAAEAQRILDRAARRLMQVRLDADAIGAAARTNDGTVDDRDDEGSPLVKRQRIPVASTDRDRGRGGRG